MTAPPRRAFLVGPTASGKTAVGVELAVLLDAEILSMDSMLVYRGMDLGTAKPGAADLARVPHHLIDLVEPHQSFSVARYLEEARRAEERVRSAGRRPLYVGGTGLYLKSLTAGLFDGPEVPAQIREQAAAQLRAGGRAEMRAELQRGDPDLHARLHPNDDLRLLRGVETLRATGRPLSSWQQQWRERRALGEPAVALSWPREELRERVASRFDAMLEAGLVEEVQRIRAAGGFSRSARQALGYRQILEHLEGRCSLDQARSSAVAATRVLIRRQMTWLRSFPDLQWLEAAPGEPARRLAEKAARLLEAAGA